MARVVLASALSRWASESGGERSQDISLEVGGAALDEVLDGVFARFPNLRGYVLDEHGGVRHHVAIFVDGTSIADKRAPRQPLRADAEVYVMQALSGG